MILAVGKRGLTVVSFGVLIRKSYLTWSPREYGTLSNKSEIAMLGDE